MVDFGWFLPTMGDAEVIDGAPNADLSAQVASVAETAVGLAGR